MVKKTENAADPRISQVSKPSDQVKPVTEQTLMANKKGTKSIRYSVIF